MSIPVKLHHPLQELLAQLLFGIESVPQQEQKRMVNFACKKAVEWHDKEMNKISDLAARRIAHFVWNYSMSESDETINGMNCDEYAESMQRIIDGIGPSWVLEDISE
jgi:hypothetical protein